MNCFEVRNDFGAFWQKKLAETRRAQLLAHVQRCASCDRSFRSFALTAPVLYSASEPEWESPVIGPAPVPTAALDGADRSAKENHWPAEALSRALPAFVMAAAAVIALYFAVPRPMTFEDAIAADNPNVEAAAPLTDSLFGQEVIAQNVASPDAVDE